MDEKFKKEMQKRCFDKDTGEGLVPPSQGSFNYCFLPEKDAVADFPYVIRRAKHKKVDKENRVNFDPKRTPEIKRSLELAHSVGANVPKIVDFGNMHDRLPKQGRSLFDIKQITAGRKQFIVQDYKPGVGIRDISKNRAIADEIIRLPKENLQALFDDVGKLALSGGSIDTRGDNILYENGKFNIIDTGVPKKGTPINQNYALSQANELSQYFQRISAYANSHNRGNPVAERETINATEQFIVNLKGCYDELKDKLPTFEKSIEQQKQLSMPKMRRVKPAKAMSTAPPVNIFAQELLVFKSEVAKLQKQQQQPAEPTVGAVTAPDKGSNPFENPEPVQPFSPHQMLKTFSADKQSHPTIPTPKIATKINQPITSRL